MSIAHLPRNRIRPEVMVEGVRTFPMVPRFANFTFTPRGLKPVDNRDHRDRVRYVNECLERGIHPSGELAYSYQDGGGFTGERRIVGAHLLREAMVGTKELGENWDPTRVVVALHQRELMAAAFSEFKRSLMARVLVMGREGYDLTSAEICVVDLKSGPDRPTFESGVRYRFGDELPILKLVIGPNTLGNPRTQICIEPMQNWFKNLKVEPVLTSSTP